GWGGGGERVGVGGGRLWLEGEGGGGSPFHFTAGFARVDADAPAVADPAVELQGLRVLVVDDNATNRRILTEVLLGWMMKPDAAAGGAEGLEMLAAARTAGRPYAVVIVDGQMPQMDGFMFAHRMRRDRRGPALPPAA